MIGKKFAQNLFLMPSATLQISKTRLLIKQTSRNHSLWNLIRLFLRNILYRKNNCEKEINLAPQERIGNIDWCKCGWKSKPMATFGESLCLLVWLKTRSVSEASHHSAFMGNFPILATLVSLTYLVDEFFLFLL